MKTVKIALIGTGRWGSKILRTLDTMPGVVMVSAGREAAPDADAVIVTTPGATHVEVAMPLIKRGLPVFVEKPLVTNWRDALKLEQAAEVSRTLVFVGHIHLYNPAYLTAKKLIKKAGQLRQLRFESMNNGPIRDDMSALWDWGPHDVAAALDLLGQPLSVQAWGQKILRPETDLYDFAQIKLNYETPLTVLMSMGWLSPEKRKKMTAIGSRDTIIWDDTAEHKVAIYKTMGPKVTGQKVKVLEPEIIYPEYDTTSPLTCELASFIACVQKKTKPPTNLKHGLDVIRILAAAEKSITANGRIITL